MGSGRYGCCSAPSQIHAERLQQVAEGGGTPAVLTPLALLKHDSLQRWPHFLPDGRHFPVLRLGPAGRDGRRLRRVARRNGSDERIVAGFSEARYSDGMLFFVTRHDAAWRSHSTRSVRCSGLADPDRRVILCD